MTYKVNKSISGRENLYALIQHTWPDHADVLNEDNVTLTRGAVTDPASDTISLIISTSSPQVTGNKEVTYTVTNLENLSLGKLIALNDVEVAQLVSTIVNNKIPCLPSEVVVGDLIRADGSWTVSLSAAEDALTVTGSTELAIEEDLGYGEELVLHSQGDMSLRAPVGSILYSIDEKETWQENTAVSFTVSIPSGVETTVYLKSNDDVELTGALEVVDSSANSNNFKGVHQWWESSRPIRLKVKNNPFYVPNSAPPNITDMSEMFRDASGFNAPLSNWNTSKVTNMSGMFHGATVFTCTLANWNTSNVTDMSYMFHSARAFNCGLTNWDTSNVTNMSYMFYGATEFSGELVNWDVSSVTDMSYMFYGASSFNGDLSNWNTSNVTNMRYMFLGASVFNSDISQWDVTSVTATANMFQNAKAFNADISQWEVAGITVMNYMLSGATSFNQDLSNWCVNGYTSAPTSFSDNTPAWTLPKPNWGQCPVRPGVGDVGHGEYLVLRVTGRIDVSAPRGGISYSIDDGVTFTESTAATTNIDPMKTGISKVYLRSNDIEGLEGHLVVNASSQNNNNFRGVEAWWESARPIRLLTSGTSFFVPETAPPNITDMSGMFQGAVQFNSDLSLWDVSKVTNMSSMFAGARGYNRPMGNWNTANVTDMSYMFQNASAFNQDITGWDTSSVTNMDSMFHGAAGFNQEIGTWDVSSVTNMRHMFLSCRDFNGDISEWDVSSVANMTGLFYSTTSFNQDLSGWCVSNIPTEPNNFSGSSYTLPKPIWGTCPAR